MLPSFYLATKALCHKRSCRGAVAARPVPEQLAQALPARTVTHQAHTLCGMLMINAMLCATAWADDSWQKGSPVWIIPCNVEFYRNFLYKKFGEPLHGNSFDSDGFHFYEESFRHARRSLGTPLPVEKCKLAAMHTCAPTGKVFLKEQTSLFLKTTL